MLSSWLSWPAAGEPSGRCGWPYESINPEPFDPAPAPPELGRPRSARNSASDGRPERIQSSCWSPFLLGSSLVGSKLLTTEARNASAGDTNPFDEVLPWSPP